MSVTSIVVTLLAIGLAWFIYSGNQKQKQIAQINRLDAEEFLAKNTQKEGVVTTESGLQYEIIHKGEGTTSPSLNDSVTVHYHGTLLSGVVFDSSVDRGEALTFSPKQVISGWTEALQLMVEGDKFRLYIHPELGYGDRAAGKIGAGSLLIFEVELIEIK
ncbi:FKBP-type peptidyl-prolyl cis-trans isomerase [Pseudoalteromonas luteoviolacea]|uniref:FKBP-type peptidyl-prolyl cis-trans isomerase n=1 Tax=Pseudoalteromonas luteoviolacea TaxID=43657 RepID=UPI001B3888FE|nr:FKBP-type peptidyl-prolyl cis-trans isomerase [Pseudoalteromonas luteoviolacea]MBQ4813027.1 FKBP-type peptidyl-prolyl cis-trans isomerase [Pseudoalteromonas luteoviolacea]